MAKLNLSQDSKVTLTLEKLNVTCLINKVWGEKYVNKAEKRIW